MSYFIEKKVDTGDWVAVTKPSLFEQAYNYMLVLERGNPHDLQSYSPLPMNYTWTHLEQDTTLDTTTEGIRAACSALGVYPDQLADLLTGYNCDSDADAAEELVEESEGILADAIEYDEDTYNRCHVYHVS